MRTSTFGLLTPSKLKPKPATTGLLAGSSATATGCRSVWGCRLAYTYVDHITSEPSGVRPEAKALCHNASPGAPWIGRRVGKEREMVLPVVYAMPSAVTASERATSEPSPPRKVE